MNLRAFAPRDETSMREMLRAEGWAPEQIEGQLDKVSELADSESGLALVVEHETSFYGFLSAEYNGWNGLAQIHGLAVVFHRKRQGIGSLLLRRGEEFARSMGARGLYVDTPITNVVARAFYESNGYTVAYLMPRYYSDELDGVTLTKFLR